MLLPTRRLLLISTVLMLVPLGIARANTYESPFGFSIDLPPGWIVLSGKEIKENPDLFNAGFQELSGSMDPSTLRLIKEQIASGAIEMYFDQGEEIPPGTVANINVNKGIGQIPKSRSELRHFCDEYSKLMENLYHKKLAVRTCEQRDMPAGAATYVNSTGVRDGTRMVQYQFQKSMSVFVTITGTFSESSFGQMNEEFERIVRSLKFR